VLAGEETEVCLFCLRLQASKVPFVQALRTEKLEAFLAGHRLAFEWLGGVPRDLLYDNPRTAVVRILAGPECQEHEVFSSLRAHYLFNSHFCGPGEAHEKGAVEQLVGYVRRTALVPMPEVPDLASLNQRLLTWCERERERHLPDWRQEQAVLRPLPAHPFRCSLTHLVRVSKLSLVTHDRVRYSVPTRCVGQTVRLESLADRVEVWYQSTLIAQHMRSYRRGDTQLQLEHYLDALARKPRAVVNAAVVRQLPAVYQLFREHLCMDNLHGYREFCQLLWLHREFPAEQVQAVLEQAWQQGITSYPAVRQLLLNATRPPAPPRVPVPTALQGRRHRTSTATTHCWRWRPMAAETTREALIELYCKQLRLPGVRQIYREAARQAAGTGEGPLAFLAACLAHEVEIRQERQYQRRLKQARFPWVNGLGDFDFTVIPQLPKPEVLALAQGEFIRTGQNVLCIGNSGTGKSHIAIALGLAAIEAGFTVRFINVMELAQELLLAAEEYRLPRYLKSWDKLHLAILDEFAYLGLGPGGPLLFQFCARRYERGSVITTNLEFSRWAEVLSDAALTTALLDRLTHHSHVLLFEGESYRFRESQQQRQQVGS